MKAEKEQNCKNCKWTYIIFSVGKNKISKNLAKGMLLCKRCPKEEWKGKYDFCGEYKLKVNK